MALAAADTEPPSSSMALVLSMPILNHGSRRNTTPVKSPSVAQWHTMSTMVATVWDRIAPLLGSDERGRVSALAELAGVSYQAARKVSLGGGMHFDKCQLVAQKLGVDAKWIYSGDEPRPDHATQDKVTIEEFDRQSRGLQISNLEHIPQYDTGGRMGHSGLVLRDQPGEIMGWDVSPEWLRKNVPNCTTPKNLAIVTGFGDSMRPLYNPGDPLLVDRGVTSVDFDAIYFFRVGDEGFIKRLQRIPGNGILAISENSSYRDWTITKDMDFQVFARVIKVWRGDDF